VDGLRDGSISVAATDHVPDRLDREKRWAGQPFPDVSNGAPGIETLLAVVYSEGVAAGRLSLERMVDVLSTTPARLFGLARRVRSSSGRRGRGAVRPRRAADAPRRGPASHERLLALRGDAHLRCGRRVLVRGRTIVEGDRFVGERGYGRFQERRLATPAGV
jgi:dihydropyrimidinase